MNDNVIRLDERRKARARRMADGTAEPSFPLSRLEGDCAEAQAATIRARIRCRQFASTVLETMDGDNYDQIEFALSELQKAAGIIGRAFNRIQIVGAAEEWGLAVGPAEFVESALAELPEIPSIGGLTPDYENN